MDTTDGGMVISSSAVQSWNTESPMVVMPIVVPKDTYLRDAQPCAYGMRRLAVQTWVQDVGTGCGYRMWYFST